METALEMRSGSILHVSFKIFQNILLTGAGTRKVNWEKILMIITSRKRFFFLVE